jgi:hypothetical protein
MYTTTYRLGSYHDGRLPFFASLRDSIKGSLRWATRLAIAVFTIIGVVFTAVYIGMNHGTFNVRGSITERNAFYGSLVKAETPATSLSCTQSVHDCAWASSPQWATINAGLTKDASQINEAAGQTGVSARMIASAVVPEQLRFFTSEREVFEKYFQPLKILGSMSEFSLGVAGVKQQTADTIEENAANINSPFYAGPAYANIISYPTGTSHATVQFDRLTSTDQYYDYLYVGLYIKEIETQWQKAGYNISERPDVVTTLYNIGFSKSQPKPDPQTGGSTITVGGQSYSFGELGTLFYNSNQLTAIFPQPAS